MMSKKAEQKSSSLPETLSTHNVSLHSNALHLPLSLCLSVLCVCLLTPQGLFIRWLKTLRSIPYYQRSGKIKIITTIMHKRCRMRKRRTTTSGKQGNKNRIDSCKKYINELVDRRQRRESNYSWLLLCSAAAAVERANSGKSITKLIFLYEIKINNLSS